MIAMPQEIAAEIADGLARALVALSAATEQRSVAAALVARARLARAVAVSAALRGEAVEDPARLAELEAEIAEGSLVVAQADVVLADVEGFLDVTCTALAQGAEATSPVFIHDGSPSIN